MIKCYATGHQHSNVIMAAFSDGCKGQIVPPHRLLDGPAAFYGILRGTGEILKQCDWVGRDFYYIDHGYIGAGHYEGYYRVTKNARQYEGLGRGVPTGERFDVLGVDVRPWKRAGRNVLVIPFTGAVASHLGIDGKEWLQAVCSEVTQFTDRPVIVKPKQSVNASAHEVHTALQDALSDCWCVVTHSSNVAVDALLEGIPVITLGESVADPISWDFEHIENPVWPDRDAWVRELANHQFTLDEMRSGLAWNYVK